MTSRRSRQPEIKTKCRVKGTFTPSPKKCRSLLLDLNTKQLVPPHFDTLGFATLLKLQVGTFLSTYFTVLNTGEVGDIYSKYLSPTAVVA